VKSTTHEIVVQNEAIMAGHVHNVKYLEFLELARKPWYDYIKSLGIISFIAHVSAAYKREAFLEDRLLIHTYLDHVGNTSFVLKQTINNQHNQVVLEAEVTLVSICKETRKKIRVPDELRHQSSI
jgi:thioesterase III